MISILKENAGNLFLPEDDGIQFRENTDKFLKGYTALARKADNDALYLWKMVPKFHWLWHLADKSRYLNPRANACMLDEDFVGKKKVVVAACVQGTALEDVPVAVMAKTRWIMHFANDPAS